MPRTEAGKRLAATEVFLPYRTDPGDFYSVDLVPSIDAIEAEAREQEADKWSALFDDEKYGIRKARREIEANTEHAIRASERARIRAAVEGLPHVECGDLDCSHDDLSYSQREHPWLDRAAVLAIIDGEYEASA